MAAKKWLDEHVTEQKTGQGPADNPHLEYRPDIDGLRTVAISAVVLFHAFPSLVSGGFVGVDVFFVISGYLITGLILKGLLWEASGQGSFSFRKFYANRIDRKSVV